MKNNKLLYYLLMFLPLVITVLAFPFLPESIPAHYNFAGEIDRWGSKYEMLIFPVITIGMGFFMLWMAKISSKNEDGGKNNEKIVYYTGMGISVWFTIMHGYSLYKAFAAAGSMGYAGEVDINQILCIVMGIGMVILGNFMPKLRNNSVIGLRTVWSMKNDTTWKKSQMFGGICFMVGGALMVIAGIFFDGYTAMFIALGILMICAIVGTIYSYKIAKKY